MLHTARRVGFWTAFALAAALAPGRNARAATDAERAAQAGQLVTLKNQRVLRLFGGDVRARGFAHGYLLGPEIVACLEDALQSLPLFTAEKFERQLRPWATKKVVWDPAAVAELEGLFAGLSARCGPAGLVCRPLSRALNLGDLYAANAVADWFGPACSGFTAWGALTSDGTVLHGRNLDFPMGARAQANQVILAVDALPSQDGPHGSLRGPARALAWVGVGWPGLICVYSAMNAEGLVCCLHDAVNVVTGGAKDGLVPRGLLLRRMVETLDCAAADPAAAAAKLAAERPVACGNLFHLSWPRAAAEKTPAHGSIRGPAPTAVLEFDAQGRESGGTPVAIRRPEKTLFLVATNHYCVRRPPLDCARFERLTKALEGAVQDGSKLDLGQARKILRSAELPLAAHTLVFCPDERRLTISITRDNLLSTRLPGVAFTWQELFSR